MSPVSAADLQRTFTRAEYDQMIVDGVLDERDKVELLFGRIVPMSPIGADHVESVATIDAALQLALSGRARVICGGALAATENSEPEPDVFVAPLRKYWGELPARAYLVVEVARSSLARDRGDKVRLYGLAEVDEYWLVDHAHGVVEVRRDRRDGRWRSVTIHQRGESIAMLAFPDVTVAVSEILPPISAT